MAPASRPPGRGEGREWPRAETSAGSAQRQSLRAEYEPTAGQHAVSHSRSPDGRQALGSPPVRPRDLETLELPRVLAAIAALARPEAGRDAAGALRPGPDRALAEQRPDTPPPPVAPTPEAGAGPAPRAPRPRPPPPQTAPP